MKNRDVSLLLKELADHYEMAGVEFKPAAYRRAAESVLNYPADIEEVARQGELLEVPGIGKGIAEKIDEFMKTGHISKLEQFRKAVPVDIETLETIEGLGPKKIYRLYRELGIKSVEDLEEAAREGLIERVPGFGHRTQEKILENIAFAESVGSRHLLGFALREADIVIREMGEWAERIDIAGSMRRGVETVGDADILSVAKPGVDLMEKFVSMKGVYKITARGISKTSVVLEGGMRSDLRVVPKESYGSALLYFTGSKAHNIALRRIAQRKGWKLNEYGLFEGEKSIAGRTEEEVYAALGLPWIPPELREDRGEIEAAIAGKLPKLVERSDIKGDLQMHTTWSDGKNTVSEMAKEAISLGHEYIAITDHGGSIHLPRVVDEKIYMEQRKEVRAVEANLDGFRILHGLELNIQRDGSLDMPREVLAEMDIVIAGLHSAQRMESKEMTNRLVKAMENEYLDIFVHPTQRLILSRRPIEFDMERVLQAAADNEVAVEIDSFPERLDLSAEHIRMAVDMGVKLSIDTDSHRADQLSYMDLGIINARRGWAKKEDLINTLPFDSLVKRFER